MAFSYPALVGCRGIRLLKFTGLARDGETLTFSLQSTSYQIPKTIFIDNRPVLQGTTNDSDDGKRPIYHALSYVWGDAAHKETIVCNDAPVEVTKNLHEALGQLCPQFPDRVLWVDSLCINQNDSAEKAGQVAMMGEVFAAACNVICWLGPADDLHRAYKRKLARLVGTSRFHAQPDFQCSLDEFRKARACLEDGAERTWCSECDRGLFERLYFCGSDRHRTTATTCLGLHETIEWMGRSTWFSRVWTFQELIRSATAVVHMGPYFISWNDFALASIELQLDQPHRARDTLQLNRFMREFLTGRSSFAQCLTAMRHRKSSIHHDKVFGIMGLLGNVSPSTLRVDYSLSVGELNAAVTRFLALEDQGPGLLRNCRRRTHTIPFNWPWGGGYVPSWIVDICEDYVINRETYIDLGRLPELSDSGRSTLSLHGLVVGHVPKLQSHHFRPIIRRRRLRPIPLSSIFKGLPRCMLRGMSSRSGRVASTDGSWDEKQSILPRLAVDYDPETGCSISARFHSRDDLTKAFEDPGRLYDGLKAHRLQTCGCPGEATGCSEEEGDVRVYWVCLLANPRGQLSPSLFLVEQAPDASFTFIQGLELPVKWEETRISDVSESEEPRGLAHESEFPLILTPMALRG